MLTSFRFWGSERGNDKLNLDSHSMQASATFHQPLLSDKTFISPPYTPVRPPKRRRDSLADAEPWTHEATTSSPPAKRPKPELSSVMPVSSPETSLGSPPTTLPATASLDEARDAIHYQFGLEILLKHDELRLINQELAKCQVALEQLRRCHLIPYPVTCPTPAQMLDISSGKGPAVRGALGQVVPQWAPPFGVVEGPYARHYAKWLIPDPKFDGIEPEWHPVADGGRGRVSVEGRTTRNSIVDFASLGGKSRPARGIGSKLHSLSNGYPQPKDKAGPCVLKRSDGQTVKLVCIDCQRENFSSTQGFINHCRIAHRRDFKSHEEAAVHCGHAIDASEPAPAVQEEKDKVVAAPAARASGLVHPLVNAHATEQQAYSALQSRIAASLDLYHQGKLPGVTSIPTSTTTVSASAIMTSEQPGFAADESTPFLSRLLLKRKFDCNLADLVKEAKQKVALDEMLSPSEDSEDLGSPAVDDAASTRPAIAMRIPARAISSPAPLVSTARPTSSKGRSPRMGFASPPVSVSDKDDDRSNRLIMHDEPMDLDTDMSPSTLVSNNAPSLVSDDGEYDDSDDGCSVSGASDAIESGSVSDVAEISIEEDHEPPSMRHHRTSSGVESGLGLKKDESKHVTFITPVNNGKRARKL